MKDKMMDVENVGIMQGFLDDLGEEEALLEAEESTDDSVAARILDRRPGSPEILMNNLRGDMRSVEARREELADLVGYEAAAETPEAVLAMLQPVLAQGGLGALPQSGDMAQGPQPPMMPPPPGGEMMGGPPPGEMPPGAPPLPPEAAPMPAGAEMAAPPGAGLPPGGGMAPGGPPPEMMIGPDGQPIPPEGLPPIQMRDGGFVQRFRDGSPDPDDEDAETQKNLLEGGIYSPELVALARQEALKTISRKPTEVPSLEEAMKGRLPEYERLLGSDKSDAQSGLLFDIAGAALNFASNRGPRGEVLRGSPVSRFAGAFSGLPAAVQKRVSDIEETQRKLKMAAIQAGERDRERIQDLNAKAEAEKRSIINTVLRADAQATASQTRLNASATGTRSAWEMNVFNQGDLIYRWGRGETTPPENNLVGSAITSYTEPRYQAILDDTGLPTGNYETLPGKKLPDHVLRAQRSRQEGIVPSAETEFRPEPRVTPAPAQSDVPSEITEAPAPLLSEGANTPTEAGTAQPTDRSPDEPSFIPWETARREPINLWRDRAYIAGPFASVYGTVSAIPGLGDPAPMITLARSQAEGVAKEAEEAFLKSAQRSVTEQKMIREVLRLKPAALKDPETYGTQLIALGTLVDQLIEENRKKIDIGPTGIGSRLSSSQRSEAVEKLSFLERLRGNLGLPPAFPADPNRQAYLRQAQATLPKKEFDALIEAELAKVPPDVTEVLWLGITPAKIRGR